MLDYTPSSTTCLLDIIHVQVDKKVSNEAMFACKCVTVAAAKLMVGIKLLQVHSLMQVYQKQLLHGVGQAYLSAKHIANFQAISMKLSCCIYSVHLQFMISWGTRSNVQTT